jgi:hypothetical protein
MQSVISQVYHPHFAVAKAWDDEIVDFDYGPVDKVYLVDSDKGEGHWVNVIESPILTLLWRLYREILLQA